LVIACVTPLNRSCVDFKLCLIDANDFVKCAHTASNYDS